MEKEEGQSLVSCMLRLDEGEMNKMIENHDVVAMQATLVSDITNIPTIEPTIDSIIHMNEKMAESTILRIEPTTLLAQFLKQHYTAQTLCMIGYPLPADLIVGQFVCVVRKRIKLRAQKAIFIRIPFHTAAITSAIYEENKDEDGFLYMTYSG
ncbi:hypothetical protein IEQ34_017787 [Dendrobium chrysotoxum]|uniref:Autophagy-related protein n=1 Tax=Dendrobium chrysotoxum TaxID=161865 RepID=A0AAV7GCM0_DENCH|nr:hypothetical protein IEQ34_017787 [Dendrobium chrysotoxum]